MSAWVAVPGPLAAKASELISLAASRLASKDLTLDLPRDLVAGLIEYFGEDMGCDHSVNVCTCDMDEARYGLTLALVRQQVCPRCHGKGMVEYRDHGMATCPRCFTSGVCAIDTGEVNG